MSSIQGHPTKCKKLSPQKKSRQQHSFLLLELLIALFLVGMCVLPLAQFPMRSFQEEIKSCYRLQLPRLADLAFAEIKEKLYRHEISWKDLTCSKENKAKIMENTVDSLAPLGKQKFKRTAYVYAVGKKKKTGEEVWFATFQIEFAPESGQSSIRRKKTSSKAVLFTYQLLLEKKLVPEPNQT